MSSLLSLASAMAFLTGTIVFLKRSLLSSSNRARRTLGALALAAELAQRACVAGDVAAVLPADDLDEVVHEALVEVLAAEVGVAVGGKDLKHAVVDGEDADVERAATEVEDEDVLLGALLVDAVGDGGGGGLVDDAVDGEPGDDAGVLGGLPLRVVEVGRDGDDGAGDLLAEVGLGRLLHPGEHHGAHLLGAEHADVAVLHLDAHMRLAIPVDDGERQQLHVALHLGVGELPADEALCVVDCPLWVGRRLVLGGLADEPLAAVGEGDPRGRNPVSLVVGDDLDMAVPTPTHEYVVPRSIPITVPPLLAPPLVGGGGAAAAREPAGDHVKRISTARSSPSCVVAVDARRGRAMVVVFRFWFVSIRGGGASRYI
uniref:Uncharacterized protein n=1 Tax=Oryza punctata TaxID=4537 RepID=A0A0E0L2V5_ORYPU